MQQDGSRQDGDRSPYRLLNKTHQGSSAIELTKDIFLKPLERADLPAIQSNANLNNFSNNPLQLPDSSSSRIQLPIVPAFGDSKNLDKDFIDPLKEIVKELQEKLAFEEMRKSGAFNTINSINKERSENRFSEIASGVFKQPYALVHHTANYFDWGICKAPPTSLGENYDSMIEESRSQIKYHDKKISVIKEKIAQIEKQLDEVEKIGESLKQDQDPRRFIDLRQELARRSQVILSLVDQAKSADDPELKAEWDKKRKSISDGFRALEDQLDFTESSLKVTQKVVIITGAIVATGGAAAPAAAGGLGLGAGGAGLGFWGSVGVGTLTGTVASSGQIVGENIGRGATGQNFMTSGEMASKLSSDVKDAALYSLGSAAAPRILGGLSRYAGNLVMRGHGAANSAAGSTNLLVQTVRSNSPLRSTYALVRNGVGSLTSGGGHAALTEAPAAIIDTYLAVHRGEVKPVDYCWEVFFRMGNAGAGGSIGKCFSGGRANVSNFASRITGGNGGVLDKSLSLGLKSLTYPASYIAEVYSDLKVSILAEDVKAGWIYGKEGGISNKEREQIFVSTIIGNVNGWRTEYSQNKFESKKAKDIDTTVREVHGTADKVLSETGLGNDLSVYAGSGNPKTLRVQGSPDDGGNISVHLGRDTGTGKHQVKHSAMNQLMQFVDRQTGGRLMNSIVLPAMNQIRAFIPKSSVEPNLSKERIKFEERLFREIDERAHGVSSLAREKRGTTQEYAEALASRARDFNNSRKVNDADDVRVKRGIVQRLLDSKPYGEDRALKILKISDINSSKVVSDFLKYGSEKTSSFLYGLSTFAIGTKLTHAGVNFFKGVGNLPVIKQGLSIGGNTVSFVSKYTVGKLVDASVWSYTKTADSFIGKGAIGFGRFVNDAAGIVYKPAYGLVKAGLFMPTASAGPGGGLLKIPFTDYGLPVPGNVGLILTGVFIAGRTVEGTFKSGSYVGNRTFATFDALTMRRLSSARPEDAAKMLAHIKEGEFYKAEIETTIDKGKRDSSINSETIKLLEKRLSIIDAEIKESRKLYDIASKRGLGGFIISRFADVAGEYFNITRGTPIHQIASNISDGIAYLRIPLISAPFSRFSDSLKGNNSSLISRTNQQNIELVISSTFRNSLGADFSGRIKSAGETFINRGVKREGDIQVFTQEYLPLLIDKVSPLSKVERQRLFAEADMELTKLIQKEKDQAKKDLLKQKHELLNKALNGTWADVLKYVKDNNSNIDTKKWRPKIKLNQFADIAIQKRLSNQTAMIIKELARIEQDIDPNIQRLQDEYIRTFSQLMESTSVNRRSKIADYQDKLILEARLEADIKKFGSEHSEIQRILSDTSGSDSIKKSKRALIDFAEKCSIPRNDILRWVYGNKKASTLSEIDIVFERWRTSNGSDRKNLEARIKQLSEAESLRSLKSKKVFHAKDPDIHKKNISQFFQSVRRRLRDTMTTGGKTEHEALKTKLTELMTHLHPEKAPDVIAKEINSYLTDMRMKIPSSTIDAIMKLDSKSDQYKKAFSIVKEILANDKIDFLPNLKLSANRQKSFYEKAVEARILFDDVLLVQITKAGFANIEPILRSLERVTQEIINDPSSTFKDRFLNNQQTPVDRLSFVSSHLKSQRDAIRIISQLDYRKSTADLLKEIDNLSIDNKSKLDLLAAHYKNLENIRTQSNLEIFLQLSNSKFAHIPGAIKEITKMYSIKPGTSKSFNDFIESIVRATSSEKLSAEDFNKALFNARFEIIKSRGLKFEALDKCLSIIDKHKKGRRLSKDEARTLKGFIDGIDAYVKDLAQNTNSSLNTEKVINNLLSSRNLISSHFESHATHIVNWKRKIDEGSKSGISKSDMELLQKSLIVDDINSVLTLQNKYDSSSNTNAKNYFQDIITNWSDARRAKTQYDAAIEIYNTVVGMLLNVKDYSSYLDGKSTLAPELTNNLRNNRDSLIDFYAGRRQAPSSKPGNVLQSLDKLIDIAHGRVKHPRITQQIATSVLSDISRVISSANRKSLGQSDIELDIKKINEVLVLLGDS